MRAHVYRVLGNPDGSVMTGAVVRVLQNATLSLLTDTLYTTDQGSEVLANPFTCVDGVVEFYLDIPNRVRLGYTPPGGSEQFATVDAEPDASALVQAAVPMTITNAPVDGLPLVGNSDGETATFKGIPTDPDAPTGLGERPEAPAPVFYMVDTDDVVWDITIDTTGHFVSTVHGG